MDKMKLKFSGAVIWDPMAKDGDKVGAHRAHMVCFKEGHDVEADAVMRALQAAGKTSAFASAGGHGVRVRDGVTSLTTEQIKKRMTQLKDMPAHAETCAELGKALKVIENMDRTRGQGFTPERARAALTSG